MNSLNLRPYLLNTRGTTVIASILSFLCRRIAEHKYPESHRTAASNSSDRDFRATCERALREQQEQIARVAAICEKLAQPQMMQNCAQDITSQHNEYKPPQLVQNVAPNLNNPSQNINNAQNFDNSSKPNAMCVQQKQNLPQKPKRRPVTTDSSDFTSSTCSSRDTRRKHKHRVCSLFKVI